MDLAVDFCYAHIHIQNIRFLNHSVFKIIVDDFLIGQNGVSCAFQHFHVFISHLQLHICFVQFEFQVFAGAFLFQFQHFHLYFTGFLQVHRIFIINRLLYFEFGGEIENILGIVEVGRIEILHRHPFLIQLGAEGHQWIIGRNPGITGFNVGQIHRTGHQQIGFSGMYFCRCNFKLKVFTLNSFFQIMPGNPHGSLSPKDCSGAHCKGGNQKFSHVPYNFVQMYRHYGGENVTWVTFSKKLKKHSLRTVFFSYCIN